MRLVEGVWGLLACSVVSAGSSIRDENEVAVRFEYKLQVAEGILRSADDSITIVILIYG